MVKIVVGEKGKGKTKVLIENANSVAKTGQGLVVYLDKNNKHMFELDNQVRYVNMSDYCEFSQKTLKGFICGLVAGNHDINVLYVDGFLTLADHDCGADLTPPLEDLQKFSEANGIDIVLSISVTLDSIPEKFKDNVLAAL